MTENEAIVACERKARKSWGRPTLGPLVDAHFIDQDSPVTKFHSDRNPVLGKWLVSFHKRGLPSLDVFYVDDVAGKVEWTNGPPSFWFGLIGSGVWIALAPLWLALNIHDRIHRAWSYWRLPRCPYCHGKLRTRKAQQCRWCYAKWHKKKDA